MRERGRVGLAGSRRLLHRATRLAAAGRMSDAVPLALLALENFRRHAARDARRRDEYVAALRVTSDLQLALADLRAGLDTLHVMVAVLDTREDPRTDLDRDRLAAALTRRGDTVRLSAEYDNAASDLDRAVITARGAAVRAWALNAKGILAKDTGRYDQAAGLYAEALVGLRQVLGDDHPDIATLFHNLAGLEHAKRDFQAGEALARRAVALREKGYGADSAEVAADLAVLGALLAGQGRYDEAEAVFLSTTKAWTRLRGPDHYEVAVASQHLAAPACCPGRRPPSPGRIPGRTSYQAQRPGPPPSRGPRAHRRHRGDRPPMPPPKPSPTA